MRAESRVTSKLHFIEPQLATLVEQPPLRSGWIHEVKHDGYRTLLVVERRKARAYTRNGFDWSDRYPGIVQDLQAGDFALSQRSQQDMAQVQMLH